MSTKLCRYFAEGISTDTTNEITEKNNIYIYIYKKRWNNHLQYKICYNIFRLSNLSHFFHSTLLDMCVKRLLHVDYSWGRKQNMRHSCHRQGNMEAYWPRSAFLWAAAKWHYMTSWKNVFFTKNCLLWLTSQKFVTELQFTLDLLMGKLCILKMRRFRRRNVNKINVLLCWIHRCADC